MVAVKTYNPKDCVITVGGVYITGLGEDMVKCEKDEDNFTTKVGAQGDVVVNQSCNDLGNHYHQRAGHQPTEKLPDWLSQCGNIV